MNFNVLTTTSDSQTSLQRLQYNVWQSDITTNPHYNSWQSVSTSASSLQRVTIRHNITVLSTTSQSVIASPSSLITTDSRTYTSTSSQRLTVRNRGVHGNGTDWDPVFSSTSSLQRLTFRHAPQRAHYNVWQTDINSASSLQRLTVRQHLNVFTTTRNSQISPHRPHNNVWQSDITSPSSLQRLTVPQHLVSHSDITSTCSLQRLTVRHHLNVFSTTSDIRNHLNVFATTFDSPTSPRRLHYKQSDITLTSSQRLTVCKHLNVFSTTFDIPSSPQRP